MGTVGRAEVDVTGLVAERNLFRYRPLPGGVAVRFGPRTSDRERRLIDLAIRSTGCPNVISDALVEPDAAFAARLASLGVDRVRLVGTGNDEGPSGDRW